MHVVTCSRSQPQAAYLAFVSGFKNKLSYFMRTIPDISNMLIPIEDTIRNRFIPAIIGGRICNVEERKLLSLPTRYGGLAIPIFHEQAEVEYNNSRRITTELTSLITVQQMEYTVDELAIKKIILEIKNEKENTYKHIMEHLKDNMSEKSKRLLQLSTEKGVSNWLTMLPIAEYGFELSKQQFWDSISLRYGWEISKLPTCPCESKCDIQHCMSCKNGGFATIRHNKLRDQTLQNKCVRFCLQLDNRAHVGITKFKKINWLLVDYRFRQCFAANVFKFFDDKCPLYMKDVFEKSCMSQASTRNSTIKLSQPLRRTSYGQNCISFLAPSV